MSRATATLAVSDSLIRAAITRATIGIKFFPQSASEAAASKTPVNWYEPWGSVQRFGADDDGATDFTTEIQDTIDSVGDDGEITFPMVSGASYIFGTVTVDRERVRLSGNGTLDGSIALKHFNFATTNSLNQFVSIDGLRFVSSGNTKDAIILNSTRRNQITNCHFEGYKRCIYTPANVDNVFGQHVNRHRITGNTYADCDHFMFETRTAAISFSCADFIVTDNEGTANIAHYDLDTVDGITIADNIMFFSGSVEESAIKERCISIKFGTWLQIHDNKCFEAGLEGIKLDECSRYNVHDNQYAFCGQRVESASLLITGVPSGGAYFSQAQVHHELFIDPSGVPIQIGAKAGRLKITNNNVQTPNPATAARYYGIPALSGGLEAIDIDGDTLDITTNGNTVRWGHWTANAGVNQSNTHFDNVVDSAGDGSSTRRESKPKTNTESGTATTLVVTKWDFVNLSQSAATNVAIITNGSGQNKTVTFVAFNGNTTFVHDGINIFTATGANVTLTAGQTITFYVTSTSVAKQI